MNIKDLEYFIAVCKTKNVTKAANECFITQPALTLAIARLEKELGASLFVRTTRSLELTSTGEMLAAEGRRMIEQYNVIRHKATDLSMSGQDQIRIGITGSYGRAFLPRVCAAFHAKLPNVELIFTVGNSSMLENMLMHKELDAAIIVPTDRKLPIVHELLYQERMILAMRADDPNNCLGYIDEQSGMPHIRLAELGTSPFLMYFAERSDLNLSVQAICRENEYTPRVVFRSKQSSMLLSMVYAGIGYALIPWSTYYLNESREDVRVNAYNVPGASAQRAYVFAYRNDVYAPSSVLSLLEACKYIHKQLLETNKDLHFFAKF